MSCASLPESLIESELFGYEKGAFTGANERRIGRFEAASSGTLFLDEIGELPLSFQVKLLRVLQERQIERLGSNRPVDVDVRFVSASLRPLEEEIAAGNVSGRTSISGSTPSPFTCRRCANGARTSPSWRRLFWSSSRARAQRDIEGFSDEVVGLFEAHSWPGNVRELRNVVERAVLFCRGPRGHGRRVAHGVAWRGRQGLSAGQGRVEPLQMAVERAEVEAIRAALQSTAGRRAEAAELLGISRKTLWEKIKNLDISVDF